MLAAWRAANNFMTEDQMMDLTGRKRNFCHHQEHKAHESFVRHNPPICMMRRLDGRQEIWVISFLSNLCNDCF